MAKNNNCSKLVILLASCAISFVVNMPNMAHADDLSSIKPDVELNYDAIDSLKLTPVFNIEQPKLINQITEDKNSKVEQKDKPIEITPVPKQQDHAVLKKENNNEIKNSQVKQESKANYLFPWFHQESNVTKSKEISDNKDKTIINKKPTLEEQVKKTDDKKQVIADNHAKPQDKNSRLLSWFDSKDQNIEKKKEVPNNREKNKQDNRELNKNQIQSQPKNFASNSIKQDTENANKSKEIKDVLPWLGKDEKPAMGIENIAKSKQLNNASSSGSIQQLPQEKKAVKKSNDDKPVMANNPEPVRLYENINDKPKLNKNNKLEKNKISAKKENIARNKQNLPDKKIASASVNQRRTPSEQPVELHTSQALPENINIPKKIKQEEVVARKKEVSSANTQLKSINKPTLAQESVKQENVKDSNIKSKVDAATNQVKAPSAPKQEINTQANSAINAWLNESKPVTNNNIVAPITSPQVVTPAITNSNEQIASNNVPSALPVSSQNSSNQNIDFPRVGTIFSTKFEGSVSSLNESEVSRLTSSVQMYLIVDKKINIVSYAKGIEGDSTSARRIALQRAINTRAHLVRAGIADSRINVQVMGDKNGSKDEVDVLLSN